MAQSYREQILPVVIGPREEGLPQSRRRADPLYTDFFGARCAI